MIAVIRKAKNWLVFRKFTDGNLVDKFLHNWKVIFFWFMVFILWLYGVTNN